MFRTALQKLIAGSVFDQTKAPQTPTQPEAPQNGLVYNPDMEQTDPCKLSAPACTIKQPSRNKTRGCSWLCGPNPQATSAGIYEPSAQGASVLKRRERMHRQHDLDSRTKGQPQEYSLDGNKDSNGSKSSGGIATIDGKAVTADEMRKMLQEDDDDDDIRVVKPRNTNLSSTEEVPALKPLPIFGKPGRQKVDHTQTLL